MLPGNQPTTVKQKRKTYLLGSFIGKFYGLLDTTKTGNPYASFYDLNIYEAEVIVTEEYHIRRSFEGPFSGFALDDTFPGRLPDPLPCNIQIAPFDDYYKLDLCEPKFKEGSIQIVDHQYEGQEVFGTLTAFITGYLIDYVDVEVESPVPQEATVVPAGDEETISPAPTPIPPVSVNNGFKTDTNRFRGYTSQQTGNRYKTDYKPEKPNWLVALILLAILIIFLINSPAATIVFILLFGLLILGSVYPLIGRILVGLFYLFYLIFFLFSITRGFQDINWRKPVYNPDRGRAGATTKKRQSPGDQETTRIKTVGVPKREEVQNSRPEPRDLSHSEVDTLIVHHRLWNDYRGNQYEGDLKIMSSVVRQSFTNRAYYNPFASRSINQYDGLLSNLNMFDEYLLDSVYHMFDSIGSARKLNRTAFAEMVVSCIQDIPYTLVLDEACDPNRYNDPFIRTYLDSARNCAGNVRFGIFAPAEFVGNLKGDCDTRTLLLFTLLQHYGYGVAILSSELYKHSLLAIDLPYRGNNKKVGGKQYYAWETTAPAARPGNLPINISNMNFWRISLLNKSIDQ